MSFRNELQEVLVPFHPNDTEISCNFCEDLFIRLRDLYFVERNKWVNWTIRFISPSVSLEPKNCSLLSVSLSKSIAKVAIGKEV